LRNGFDSRASATGARKPVRAAAGEPGRACVQRE
jgi:hypothetical protein